MENMTLGTALGCYLDTVTPHKKGRAQEARRVRAWQLSPLASRQLSSLRGVDFARYRDGRLSTGTSCSSVRLELAIISHLYSVASRDWGLAGLENPIKTMRLPAPARGRNRRFLGDEEVRLIEAAEYFKPWLKPLVLLATETAMRRGELLALRWQDVNLVKRVALLRETKNGEPRTVPLSSTAVEVLRGLPRKSERVFPYEGSYVSRWFNAATLRARLDDFRFHDLRHEATSRLFELNRFTMLEISLITGHKTLAMLKRYTHLNAMHLAARLD